MNTPLNIYLVRQDDETGYDTFDSFVVACQSEVEARHTLPGVEDTLIGTWYPEKPDDPFYSGWTHSPDNVIVKLLGTSNATTPSIILSSFNAG